MRNLPLPSLQSNGVMDMEELDEDGELKKGGNSCKYIPTCDVYSVTTPRVTATRSKEVKASACKQPISNDLDQLKLRSPILTYVYSRRRKRGEENDISFIQSMGLATKSEELVEDRVKRRKNGSSKELSELGVDCRGLGKLDVLGKCNRNKITRKVRSCVVDGSGSRKGKNDYVKDDLKNPEAAKTKKWVQLSFEGVDPKKFIGLQCKVYWPLEASWYSGHIADYHSVTLKHQVKYEDGDKENLILANERIKFRVSFEEMQRLELKYCDKKLEVDGIDIDEMMVLAASLDDCPDIEHGDVIWAKLTGHAVWPAVILDKSHEAQCKGLNKVSGEKSILVQFFGTYDFARVRWKQVISLLKGLLSLCHLKCKKPTFVRGLEEAKMYLSEQKVPERMLQLRDCAEADSNKTRSEQHESGAELSDDDRLSHDDIRVTKKHYRTGYTPVHVEWRDLDKCNVCHMDEEYENNLFLQCEKCRMMVHARCYGEPEPSGGALWLCNLCRPGAPESPRCCLCPVVGGAMKPTTDGRWAHLACAIWIPETCLSDIKKMEPIDGLHRVHKDRWKLLCCICRVTYGACIQCSNYTCRMAFHPLCARAAGFCLEPEDVDRLHLVPFDEDGEDQCIQLLSFCRKHRPLSNEHISDERIELKASELVNYTPKVNTSGCARCEPYDFHRKRKNKAEVIAGASSKRMYVENIPYLIGGCSPNMPLWNKMSSKSVGPSKYSIDLQKLQTSQVETTSKILSVTDKYNYMKDTQRKRLAFGKSSIHGFGVFTKLPSRAGDMIIEYTGELIRRPVADRREHLIYNSLVGAGTYMFRIDDERVIDATRAGSIAHLINHSCEPNCYSRSITINGVDHIIIFSKRDLKQWEELTYDYRYSSDERLVCNCGSSRCRGFVNDKDAEERAKMPYVPASDLIDWNGEE